MHDRDVVVESPLRVLERAQHLGLRRQVYYRPGTRGDGGFHDRAVPEVALECLHLVAPLVAIMAAATAFPDNTATAFPNDWVATPALRRAPTVHRQHLRPKLAQSSDDMAPDETRTARDDDSRASKRPELRSAPSMRS